MITSTARRNDKIFKMTESLTNLIEPDSGELVAEGELLLGVPAAPVEVWSLAII